MKIENILFGVAGLLVGLIVGFAFANSINKTATMQAVPAASVASNTTSGNPALPPDHPPIGTSAGNSSGASTANGPTGAPQAQITEAIEKAKGDPKNFEAQMTAADLYYQIQRFEDAAKFYEAAVKLKPGDTEPLIKLGNALFDAEKYAEAEKWYILALEKEPKNINVRTDLGLTYFLREPAELDKAIKEFNTSLGYEPDHEITLQNLALAYRDKGDTANLQKTIAKLKSINPQNPALPQLEGKQPESK